MARSTLTTTIQRIQGLADQVKGLPPEEYHYFLDLIDPQPEEAPAKKTRKKRTTGNGSKSARASGMAHAIKQSLERGKPETSDSLCVAQVPNLDVPCGEREDALIHDPKGGYASYHPFEPSKPVVRATRKSKQKSEATNSTPSTEGATESVLVASSGGD